MVIIRALVVAVVAGTAAHAQLPVFEVASIRQAPPMEELAEQFRNGKMRMGMSIQNDTINIGALSIGDLVELAFRVKSFQVAGPDWIRTDRFDIVAKLPAGARPDQVPDMLHALLKERFGLVARRRPIEKPAYALVVTKDGPKLKLSDPAAAKPPDDATAALGGSFRFEGSSGVTVSGSAGTIRMSMEPEGLMRLTAVNTTMVGFAQMLTGFVDRIVVDQTNLNGTYELTVEISQAEAMQMAAARGASTGVMDTGATRPIGGGAASPVPVATDPGATTMSESLARLGLRLERRDLPIETVVIEHVQRAPTAN